jgi:hypothetical protein
VHRGWKAAAAVAVLTVAVVLSAVPSWGAPPPPPDTGDFCANVPDGFGGFTDLGSTSNDANIECLAFAEITTGNTATTYNPQGQVSRAQMAVFIARTIDLISELDNGSTQLEDLPQTNQDAFADDENVSAEAENAINRLAGAGIVSGTGSGQFSPTLPVGRAQMTTFINNAQDFVTDGDAFASAEDFFTDDNGLQPHEPNINGVAAAGIAQGVGGTLFNPSGVVSRDQMASFIIRYLTVLFEFGAIDELGQGVADISALEVTDTDGNGRLSPTDEIVLTFDGPVAVSSSITLDDVNDGDMATLTDDTPVGAGETPATFETSNDGTEVTVTVGSPLVVTQAAGQTGNNVIDGDVAVIGCEGIVNDDDGDGTVDEGEEAVTCDGAVEGDIPAGAANRSITVTPATDQTNPTDNQAGDELSFTASGITTTTVDLALFPCESVPTPTGDAVFTDGNNDNVADRDTALVDAVLVTVNGAPRNAETADAVPVVNGSVTFTVDSASADCVFAVVHTDADAGNDLDLDADETSSEVFGMSGRLTFTPPTGATGPMDENVTSTDKATDRFTGCELTSSSTNVASVEPPEEVSTTDCFTFTYDAQGDVFFIDANNDEVGDPNEQATLAQFEAALSPGDDVQGNYNATPALVSTFILGDEGPAAPGGVSATSVDQDTIRVEFNEVAGAESYNVYRLQTAAAECPAFTPAAPNGYTVAGTVPDNAGNNNDRTFNSDGLTNNTKYCFAVTTVDDGDESNAAGGPVDATTSTPPPDTTAPTLVDAELVTDTNTPNTISQTDTIELCFSEPMANPSDPQPETITIRDSLAGPIPDSAITLTNGGATPNATFALGTTASTNVSAGDGATTCPANQLIIITVTQTPTVNPGTPNITPGVQIPGTITTANEFQDVAGNQYAVAPSGDPETIDKEPTEPS